MSDYRRSTAERKARKLMRNPRLFFEDALRNRLGWRSGFLLPGERTLGRPFAIFDRRPKRRSDPQSFSAESLLRQLAEHHAVLFTVDDVECRIGVVEERLVGILQFLAHYAESHSLFLELAALGRSYPVQFGLSGELIQALRRATWFRASLQNAHHPLLVLDVFPYRVEDGVLVNQARQISMRSLPADLSRRLLSGQTGMIWPEEILGGTRRVEKTQEIDFVYTWVDGADPAWQRLYREHFGRSPDPDRFLSRDELRYSLRSLHYYCNWARHIFIVSNCAPPGWLNVDHPLITWVDHSDVISAQHLPTFNSHAIEAALVQIEGLSKLFVYMNDDFFVTAPLRKSMFFDRHDRSRVFLEPVGKVVRDRSGSEPEESWFIARLNAQRELLERYQYAATRLHHHAPYAINREHCLQMYDEFPEQVRKTASSRVRAESDYPLIAFMYQHYVLARGMGTLGDVDAQMLRGSNYRDFKLKAKSPFLCINDGGGSADDPEFDSAVRSFMRTRFPFAAPWEN